jgi:Tfp pilus assembly protein PilF
MQNTELLIAQGNTFREQHQPELALQQYMHAMVRDRFSASAFNNYGNVLRELGDPGEQYHSTNVLYNLIPTL